MKHNWTVYIVRCADGTLYTGATNNLARRLREHNLGIGAKYTRVRRPVSLIAIEVALTRSEALQLEYKVKRQSKEDKVKYLQGQIGPVNGYRVLNENVRNSMSY